MVVLSNIDAKICGNATITAASGGNAKKCTKANGSSTTDETTSNHKLSGVFTDGTGYNGTEKWTAHNSEIVSKDIIQRRKRSGIERIR